MTSPFDSDDIVRLGWRQGAILDTELSTVAAEHAPQSLSVDDEDWLILTSHDCDIANPNIDKEPVVEILRARVETAMKADKQQSWGRNPRTLQLVFDGGEESKVLTCTVHDRWTVPRDILIQEAPMGCLADKERRLVAEWLAKRYIRAAFPTAFDRRWRRKLKQWKKLLKKHSEWLQGIYMRLSTLDELADESQYKCHLILAVPESRRGGTHWANKREELAQEIQTFWEQFEPGIECAGVEVHGTDEITLADIEPYQRFDADWVSFEDDTPVVPRTADMTL
jgi:hypothetical protein